MKFDNTFTLFHSEKAFEAYEFSFAPNLREFGLQESSCKSRSQRSNEEDPSIGFFLNLRVAIGKTLIDYKLRTYRMPWRRSGFGSSLSRKERKVREDGSIFATSIRHEEFGGTGSFLMRRRKRSSVP